MTTAREQLIDTLSRDLRPIRWRSPASLAVLWLAGSWAFVITATLLVQPLRPGWTGQLATRFQFATESLLGLMAGALAIRAAVGLCFPQEGRSKRFVPAALALLAVWVASYVAGLWFPALDPSMLGKRPFCSYETLVWGLPPVLLGLWLLRRLAAFERAWTGALLGAAAGALPGLLMQLACMYDPAHILLHHLLPIAALIALGAALAPRILQRV